MRKVFLLLLFIPFFSFSQEKDQLIKIVNKLKSHSKIDSADKSVYNLLNVFFEENLQSDEPSLRPETISQLQKMQSDSKLKNAYLLHLFMFYQDNISKSLQSGIVNPKLQVDLMEVLIQETNLVYNKIPTILYIYQIEAYNAVKKDQLVLETILTARQFYPEAVPLKVYHYLSTKDETVKQDIIARHSNHWLVKAFKITSN